MSFRPSPAGPAGGLVTFSRRPGGSGPATFRTEYLPTGATPHCIDFILTADGVRAEAATVVLAGQEPLPGGPGYVSDHIGLRASLILAPSPAGGQDVVHHPV
ncbi:MAG: hypothetical protein ACRDRJ_29955 [Streptosporangiaceae bacterium]